MLILRGRYFPADRGAVPRASQARRDRGRPGRPRRRGRGRGRKAEGGKKRVEGRGEGGIASLVPELIEKAGALLGLDRKQGILVTEGKPEASLAFELLETRTDNWLTSGWSLDAVTTPTRGGLGVAKDLYKGAGLEVDLVAYVTQDYSDLFQGRFDPAFGVGLSMSF
ncbi:MAG: hypothetical protein HYU36_08345 [Planctomycetes bacterium]|nr:hypothetical protein [Planctomycetota bacterium]